LDESSVEPPALPDELWFEPTAPLASLGPVVPAAPQEPQQPPARPEPETPQWERVSRWFLEAVVVIAAAFLLALLIQLFVLKPFIIPSESMEPTLVLGDRVLVNRMIYHFRAPERGDIVVFDPPIESDEPFIKRVVAVAGDTVAVHEGKLWVNGEAQVEPYLADQYIAGEFPETKIKSGYIWAMGDNRNNSGDSRKFGPVRLESIIGEAFAIYWPISRWHGL
jgi:signal peptidase I